MARVRFYEAVWKRDGEEIFRMLMHAVDEADFMSKVRAHLAAYPLTDCLENTTIEIGFDDTRPPAYVPLNADIGDG